MVVMKTVFISLGIIKSTFWTASGKQAQLELDLDEDLYKIINSVVGSCQKVKSQELLQK